MKTKISLCLLAIIAFLNCSILSNGSIVEAKNRTSGIGAFAKEFDINLFEQNIRKALDGKSVGYAYAINQNGQLKKKGANGYAILKKDLPATGIFLDPKGIPQDPDRRMNIASVTKTITATTVLKILQDKLVPEYPNLTVDSSVEPFLPSTWSKANIKGLTFRELLSQLSGMNDNKGATDIASLKKWIETGVTRPKNEAKYINANLAIFRIIIPYLLGAKLARDSYNALAIANPSQFDVFTSGKYRDTVNNLVLQPMGILNADLKDVNLLPTRLYHTANNAPGSLVGDWTQIGGGGGWYLSAVDLARFLAHLRFNNQILNSTTRKLMDDNFMGWRKVGGSPTGDYGVYLAHGGGLNYGQDSTQTGMTSCIMNFPNGVQVSLLINSLGTYSDKYTLLRDAFDNAWVLSKINP